MKVFLVDDSALVLEKMAGFLSGIDGVEIVGQALNERDAIQSIMALKPDVVILDIQLNRGGSGIEVLKQIKKEIPPPIVMMLTNYPYPQYQEKCQALGADFFFDKVREVGKLYDILIRLLAEKLAGGCSGSRERSDLPPPPRKKGDLIGDRRIQHMRVPNETMTILKKVGRMTEKGVR